MVNTYFFSYLLIKLIMKKICIILMLLIGSMAQSQTNEGLGYLFLQGSVIDYDKQQHAALGMFGGFSGYAVACHFTENRWKRMLVGFAVGTGLGVIKETSDSRQGGTGWDWEDLAYTSAGSIVGGGIFDVLNGSSRRYIAEQKIKKLEEERLSTLTDDEKLLEKM